MAIEVEDGQPPEWMVTLEKKQKRHKLAHDIGAGAPCLNCNDGCAGLDLHFWRKICRNCKCKKEVHDVKEENSYEQFEILFGDNLKSGDRVKQLSLDLKLDGILNARKNQLLEGSKSSSSEDNLVFDWIPTDVPANLASEYLKQLPLEKLPITGSSGAVFRRQQLQLQMPLHDFKIDDGSDLTEEETKAFAEYIDNLKSNAVGKGQITKIFQEGDVEYDSSNYDRSKLPMFSNNLNSTPKPFKPSYDQSTHIDEDFDSFPPPPPELLHNEALSLKTPSAFQPYKPSIGISHPNESIPSAESVPYMTDNLNYRQQTENSIPIGGLEAQYAQMNINTKPAAPYNVESRNYGKQRENSAPLSRVTAQYSQTIEGDNTNALDTKNNNWYRNNDQDESTESLKPSDIIRKLNARPVSPSVNQSPGIIRKLHSRSASPSVNQSPDVIRKLHSRSASPSVNGSLGLDTARKPNAQSVSPSMTRSPLNTTANKNIPALNDPTMKNIDGRFVKMGTPEQFQALSSYVPRTPQVSNTLSNPEAKQYNLNEPAKTPKVHFGSSAVPVYTDDANNIINPYQEIEKIENHDLQKCHHCKLPAYPGQVVVVAERAGIESIWHPQCFVCVNCKELLVDLVYFFHKGEVYCGRHYAEELKIPRCFACDELIFLKEYTVAEGQSFHVKHFCCFECDIPLGGMQYVPKDNHPVCLSCYEIKYGKKCNYCDKMIKAGDSRVGWKELSWHAAAGCFKCIQCSKSLLGGKFMVKDNKPLCSKECAMKM
ncbi:testin isoform X2 [Planococcus citri]|uniref:testin isoform X2 n=1 Tax=Planococcus citri TaxID=170843 RepID=UPI0031F9F1F9